jgi:hypothetical protein
MKANFWKGFFKTIDAEYKNIQQIQGASGIKHQILCLGIDEEKKRIIIAQNEQDARILSMVQADMQARIKDYNILMIRPVPINLSSSFNLLAVLFGSNKLTQADMVSISKDEDKNQLNESKSKIEKAFKAVNPQLEIIEKTQLNLLPIFKELVHQLSHLKFLNELQSEGGFSINFNELLNFNPIIYDSAVGVCPIPLYSFSIEEVESFLSISRKEENENILRNHNILQFFYPPIDSLALGLIENDSYDENKLIQNIKSVPSYGHPFGKNEFLETNNIRHLIDLLKEKEFVVKGDISLDVTDKGKTERMQIKFSPRESIFKRLSHFFSIKLDVNLKDILK